MLNSTELALTRLEPEGCGGRLGRSIVEGIGLANQITGTCGRSYVSCGAGWRCFRWSCGSNNLGESTVDGKRADASASRFPHLEETGFSVPRGAVAYRPVELAGGCDRALLTRPR